MVEFNEGKQKNPLTELDSSAVKGLSPVLSKNTNELKTRVSRGISDRRVYAYFANGS